MGIVYGLWIVKDLNNRMAELDQPFWIDFSLDWRVFLAISCVSVLTGILSGLLPAVRASQLNESEILKDDTRTGSSLHMGLFSKSLVVVQISVAAIILTLVILFVRSVQNVMSIDYEYDADNVMTARIGLFQDVYPDARSRDNFLRTLIQGLKARPEIEQASTSHRYQFIDGPECTYEMPDRTYAGQVERPSIGFQMVSPGFFETVRLPLHMGRDFLPEAFDSAYPRYAIINQAMAEREWPGINPVGRQFRPDMGSEGYGDGQLPLVEVVGVTGSMQEGSILDPQNNDGASFFVPRVAGATPEFITILVRGSGDPGNLISIMREEVVKLDNNLPLYSIGTPRQINERALKQFTFFAEIFTRFGALATFLAAIGIYGVISFSVNQRIMEFGIRQALGATRSAVLKLVYSHAIRQIGLGFLIALAVLSPLILSPGLRQSLTLFFYEIDPNAVYPYFLSFGFVCLIALLAATPPAIRAARTHPAKALRHE